MAIDLNQPDEGVLGGSLLGIRQDKGKSFEDGNAMRESLKVQLDRRRLQLDLDRQSWRPNWMDLGGHFLPFRGRFLIDGNDTNKGWRRNYGIINETPLIAARTAAAGLLAGVTSPSRPWLRLAVKKALMNEPGVKEWLFETTEAMLDIFAKSNLYNSLEMCYREFVVFGILALLLEDDDETVINTQSFTIMSYYIANNKRRKVDTFLRDFQWTVRQVVTRFGNYDYKMDDDRFWENITARTRAMWVDRQYDQWLYLVHALIPNDTRKKGANGKHAVTKDGMPFRSVYYERGTEPRKILEDSAEDKKLLRQGGYREFPVMVARLYTNSEDAWGRGFAMDALGSARALQTQEKRLALAIDKLVDPPMRADPRLRNQRTSTLPGDVTFIDNEQGKVGFEPLYQTKPEVDALRANIQTLEQKINTIMFADIFAHFIQDQPGDSKQPVTAEQIQAENQEKLLMLGPVLEQLNDELLNPLVRRTFAIMQRRGLISKPPEALKGADITVDYISILHQAQKSLATGAIDQLLTFVGRVGQVEAAGAQAPSMDVIDFDDMINEYADAVGTAPSITRDEDAVKQIRDQRAQAQQQAQQAAQAQQATEAAPKVASAVSSLGSTPVGGAGGGTALDAILGGITGNGPMH